MQINFLRVILFFLMPFIHFIVFSQSLNPEVIGSTGDSFKTANSEVCFTIGEIAIETFQTGSNYLSQGFHQTEISTESIEDNVPNIQFSLFPNPSVQQLNLSLFNSNENYNLFIYDMNGKLILQETINGKSNKVIDVSTYSTGVYLLHIVDKYHQTIKVFKIQKQH